MVIELPASLTTAYVRRFLRGIQVLLRTDRPRIVFDLSRVQEIDRAGTEMLLHCVEQIIRQDGELGLACVPPEIMVVLELTCIDRLFEIFASNSEAVEKLSGIAG